jgi:hypothetical protein
MNLISKSNLTFTVYLLLFETLFGQAPSIVIDLDRVADLLKFPRSELVITDYTSQEKFIYTKKNVVEENSGRMPPVDPASILQSYWISSKTPNAFLPIIFTLSKPDAYLTTKVKKTIDALKEYAAQQSDYAYKDFGVKEASHASLFWEEIRVPAYDKIVIEPGDTWTRQDEYPKYHPANVSIVRDALSEVDVRIAQYDRLYYPNKLIKLPGGEEYFAAFNEDLEDNPKPHPVPIAFNGLNQIVLTSPIMNPYRETPVPPIRQPEPPKQQADKSAVNPPASQPPAPAPPPPLATIVRSSHAPITLALVLLALAVLAIIVFRFNKKQV